MPFIRRYAASPLRAALSGIALWLVCGSVSAQATGDPVNGKALFENTRAVSGVMTITMSCPACHGSVQDRRARIAQTTGLEWAAYADINFDTAMTRFSQAVQNQSAMQQFQALSAQQARDIAAYLGDTPETTPENETQMTFTTTAVNTVSAAQTVVLKHAVATTENLQIVGVQVAGTQAGNFSVTPQCNGLTLTPGGTCTVSVTYSPRNTTLSVPDLVFTLSQGSSGPFERVLHLSGSVSATAPPPAGGSDEGGGAFGPAWLAGLALAIGLLSRRRA